MTPPTHGADALEIVRGLRNVPMLLKLVALGEFKAVADIEQKCMTAADFIEASTAPVEQAVEIEKIMDVFLTAMSTLSAPTYRTKASELKAYRDILSLVGEQIKQSRTRILRTQPAPQVKT